MQSEDIAVRQRPPVTRKLYAAVPMKGVLEQIGHIGLLLGQLVSTAVRNPRGYWPDVRDDVAYVFRKVFLPTTITVLGYGFLVVTFAISILLFLGAPNRLGGVYLSFVIREVAPFLTGTVIAGVIGTATTSEIGARKIREELDALRVLGQDPVRMLVLPRVIAITIVTVAMDLYVIAFQVLEGVAGTVLLGDTSAAAFTASFLDNITIADLLANVLKMALVGLLIGVVCASKGLTARAGAEGVGRAVNEAVVISVLAVYIVSVVFNMILLGSNPDITVFR